MTSTARPVGAAVAASSAVDDAQTLAVDFSRRTGDVRGGATGTLYGLGDECVPTPALLHGARVTNTSQKPPAGAQHPSGDALRVERDFFAKNGEDLYVYIQDHYPDWPYHGGQRPGGAWDYLEVVRRVTDAVATESSHPAGYVFVPFNEPDGNWYRDWRAQREEFLADWQAASTTIQNVWAEHGLGRARVGGPGDAEWHPDRTRDFLSFAAAHGCLPDVVIWHELGIDSLAAYRQNHEDYRALESSLGIGPLPIAITEYGTLSDMGVPGRLVQWMSMFEETKVDAQVAYWNYAGNLSDNTARPGGANAGWWMLKWYGDLAGSQTVEVTPPTPHAVDSLQGIAAIDDLTRRATVLFGGTDADVRLSLDGLSADVFGGTVDVEVREIVLTGAEGLADTPRVVYAKDEIALDGESVTLQVTTHDRYAGYQVLVTPAQRRSVEADAAAQPWTASIEAEDMTLTDAEIHTQSRHAVAGAAFLASGGRDVGGMVRATSRADWTLDIPTDGSYRLQVIGASPGVCGQQALFVDGAPAGIVRYAAGLALGDATRGHYRGSAELLVTLAAGTRTLSLRTSSDGVDRLPNSDIRLDRVSLVSLETAERTRYPASGFRLARGATLDWLGEAAGAARLHDGQRADVYVTAMETGFYDVALGWSSAAAGAVELTVNGRPTASVTADSAGSWRSTARLHLSEGINEIELRSAGGAAVAELVTTRVRDADSAAVSVAAESAQLSGTATIITLAPGGGANGTGDACVGGLGDGAQNALTVPRAAGFDEPGDYDVTVFFANAEVAFDHPYNPQVVDRRMDILEGDTVVGSARYRSTYVWNSFQQRTTALSLTSRDQPLRFQNPDAAAPDIHRIVIASRVLGTPTTSPAAGARRLARLGGSDPAASAPPRLSPPT